MQSGGPVKSEADGLDSHPAREQRESLARSWISEGRITNVFSLDVINGKVRTVRSVINPDKLQHLGEVADVRALLRRRGTPS